jgi:hypothetical protein
MGHYRLHPWYIKYPEHIREDEVMPQIHHTKQAESCPEIFCGRKLTVIQITILHKAFHREPESPTVVVLKQLEEEYQADVTVSIRHINRLRVSWGLNRKKGRPGDRSPTTLARQGVSVVKVQSHLSFVGGHLFAAWMEEQEIFVRVVEMLEVRIAAYREAYPEESFALLGHRQSTLLHRVQALVYGPLLGIKKLTEFDRKEHALASLIGQGYQSSTLTQFLGQLERIDAAEALMPLLLPQQCGEVVYVDGHMIGFWSTRSLHKGKITMLGRIMAGSQAIIAHSAEGQGLFVTYQPPDIRLVHVIVSYCEQVVQATGIEVFVIDREVNSVDMARQFESRGWGLVSMLDTNEYQDLSSWETTPIGNLPDGSAVYSGEWQEPREDDPRQFVLVEITDRVLAYWGTSKVRKHFDPLQWPQLYRQRSEIQENSFRRMIAHGALNVNYGTKTVMGPDRHQERVKEKLTTQVHAVEKKIEKKEQVLNTQQEKVKESLAKGHGKRLQQRQQRLGVVQEELKKVQQKKQHIEQQLDGLGEPQQRADRDFRKQRIMTFRTLLLENALMRFLTTLLTYMEGSVSLGCLLELFFERSGAYVETETDIWYLVCADGLSKAYHMMLIQILQALNAMRLHHQGKPIRVRLKEKPT